MKYMLMSNEEQIAKEWEKYKGYTVRPLPSTTEYFQKQIDAHKTKHSFLMYGGTPEIRSIFQALNLKIDLMDRSKEMLRAMGRLTNAKVPISINETLHISDWLNAPTFNQYYDFVIGDDSINMVKWNQFEIFLNNTHHILKNNGIFVCHLLVKPHDQYINKTFLTLLNEFKQGIISSVYDLASQLNFICYDPSNFAMGWQRTIELLGKDKLKLFMPSFDFCNIFGYCNSQFYCPPQKQFEALAKKYFSIIEVFYPHEHKYCLFEPVYVLKKC